MDGWLDAKFSGAKMRKGTERQVVVGDEGSMHGLRLKMKYNLSSDK